MYRSHTHCRGCGYAKPGAQGIKAGPSEKLVEVLDLGLQPLANDFCGPDDERAGFAPLKVMLCPRCSLAQLSVTVRPEILYRHYSYVTSSSQMMQQHFERIISDISSETEGKSVLEIGSNDGRLLALMQDRGFGVLGVDPAENLSELARSHGVPTQTGFFGEDLARVLPSSDIVIARHVFCHVDNWLDFMAGLESVAHAETLIFLETPYVGDLLNNCEFDTIYHEHLSYLSLKAMDALLERTPFHIHRIIRYPIHGGAILIMLRHDHSKVQVSNDTQLRVDNFTVEDWKDFSIRSVELRESLIATVCQAVSSGARVAGLGASAKSTVWINACNFTRREIRFIADNTPQKQYKLSPGTDIPIVDEGAILRDLPDFVVMWAWNYRSEILEKFSRARELGVKFIVPVPTLEIV